MTVLAFSFIVIFLIIGPESDDWLCLSLTDCRLVNLIDVTFGPKAKLLFRLSAQGLVKILKLKFRRDFEAGVCSAFRR